MTKCLILRGFKLGTVFAMKNAWSMGHEEMPKMPKIKEHRSKGKELRKDN
jgi:hypothetical protein